MNAIPRFVRWRETRLWQMDIQRSRRVRLWFRVRSRSHFAGGFSWYSDLSTRDIGVHLFVLSFGIKWSPVRDLTV